ncbi:DUF4192 domain-containing protein [Demequina sp. B12]|uniref:DUF4192 family protein n=1 Tax=Demequina sp. B12 TaxID=2992757 RepID=UPI00237AC72C|nr:DUF4192 family protein [Demequina sp. B12]MDE0571809.1 DUF4192 domain-containing protein [Demequina sp. B12]
MTTTHTSTTHAQQRASAAYENARPDLADYLRALEHVKRDGEPCSDLIGKAAKALTDIKIRDCVVILMGYAPATINPDDLSDGPTETQAEAAMSRIVSPDAGVRPGTSVARHRALIELIASHVPAHAPAATLLALIAWWDDDLASAIHHLENAFEADPVYNLAHLIAATITIQPRPGWTMR